MVMAVQLFITQPDWEKRKWWGTLWPTVSGGIQTKLKFTYSLASLASSSCLSSVCVCVCHYTSVDQLVDLAQVAELRQYFDRAL